MENINLFRDRCQPFYEFAKKSVLDRRMYLEKYMANHSKKVSETVKVEQPNDEWFGLLPLEECIVEDIGQIIDKEYIQTVGDKPGNYGDKYKGGIPGNLAHLDLTIHFDFQEYPDEWHAVSKDKFVRTSAAQDCKRIFYMCIEKLKKLNINIYKIDKDLKQYWSGGVSSLCGGCNTFKFYCGKNQYRFIVDFDEDCDCPPGLLYVRKVTNIETGVEIEVHCDLFCGNSDECRLGDFTTLINSSSMEDYIFKRFGHFFELPKLFEMHGFKATCSMKEISEIYDNDLNNWSKISLNDHTYNFIIEVLTEKGTIALSPIPKQHFSNYCLQLHPTLKELHDKNLDHGFTRIDVNTFRLMNKDIVWTFQYDSKDDFPELLKYVDKYIGFENDEYAYIDGKYVTPETVKQNLAGVPKINILSQSFTYGNPEINVFVVNYGAHQNKYSALGLDRLEQEHFPYDLYGIHFVFDSAKDPNNCCITIQGKYYDATKLANDYYANEKKFDSEKYKLKVFEVCHDVAFKGSFDECCLAIRQFFTGLNEITNMEYIVGVETEEVEWGDYADN